LRIFLDALLLLADLLDRLRPNPTGSDGDEGIKSPSITRTKAGLAHQKSYELSRAQWLSKQMFRQVVLLPIEVVLRPPLPILKSHQKAKLQKTYNRN